MLEVTNLRKTYPDGSRELVVLNDASFTLESGDFIGLYGKRRCGKSTLLRIVAGVDLPDSGSVRFDGHELTSMSADQRSVFLRDRIALASTLFSSPNRNRTVGEYVGAGLRIDGHTTGRRVARRVREVLRETGVQDCYDASLVGLSLGEQIRVELARALVRRPRLLLVDDPPPLNSPSEGNDLYHLLCLLGESPERAMILASVELDLAQRAPRLMRLSQGDLRVLDRQATILEFPVPRSGTDQA